MLTDSPPSTRGSDDQSRPGSARAASNYFSWRRILGRVSLLFSLIAGLAILSITLGQLAGDHRGTLDFVNFYAAGKIVTRGQSSHLYDLRLQREIESDISPGGPFQPFYHPPFEALLFAPLSWLSYPSALRLWAGMNLLAMCVAFYLLAFTGYRLETSGYLVWLGVSLPLVIGALLLGQDTLLLALIFLSGFLALKKRRDFVAGLTLGLGLFRFEILLPFAFILLLRRRWNLMGGFFVAGTGVIAGSAALVGWKGLLDYARALVKVASSAGPWAAMTNPATMPSLRGALATFLGGIVPFSILFPLILAGTLALLGWAAWQFRSVANPESPCFDLEFSLATLAALLASYHLFVHELTPLIVVGFLAMGYEGTARRMGFLRDRAGTALLLLFTLVFFVGGAGFGFRDFSVLFFVLFGLMVWLSQEISARRNMPPIL